MKAMEAALCISMGAGPGFSGDKSHPVHSPAPCSHSWLFPAPPKDTPLSLPSRYAPRQIFVVVVTELFIFHRLPSFPWPFAARRQDVALETKPLRWLESLGLLCLLPTTCRLFWLTTQRCSGLVASAESSHGLHGIARPAGDVPCISGEHRACRGVAGGWWWWQRQLSKPSSEFSCPVPWGEAGSSTRSPPARSCAAPPAPSAAVGEVRGCCGAPTG